MDFSDFCLIGPLEFAIKSLPVKDSLFMKYCIYISTHHKNKKHATSVSKSHQKSTTSVSDSESSQNSSQKMSKNAVLQFAQQAAVLALKSKSKDPSNNDITRGRTNEEVRAQWP